MEAKLGLERPGLEDLNNADTSNVGFGFGTALTADQTTTLNKFIKGLGDGSINLLTGPLNYQDGTVYPESRRGGHRSAALVHEAAFAGHDR